MARAAVSCGPCCSEYGEKNSDKFIAFGMELINFGGTDQDSGLYQAEP